jgi:hypothetical protein
MELKSQDQKIMNYMRSIRKLTRFRNDNLTLLEQNSMLKSQNTKAIDSLSARQDLIQREGTCNYQLCH